jgi:acetoacetyl-CoA synthetase
VEVALFVVMAAGAGFTDDLAAELKARIRREASPRHVPAIVRAVPEIPRTLSGKTVELAVREALHGRPVANVDALANPGALEHFRGLGTAPEA